MDQFQNRRSALIDFTSRGLDLPNGCTQVRVEALSRAFSEFIAPTETFDDSTNNVAVSYIKELR